MRTCHIAKMLNGQKRHVSFHTPGHKRAGADITELSYSDNLLSPTGVIARAEADIAEILGADRSFLLTDGSTCGVFSMLAALRETGGASVAASEFSHPSVKNACRVLGLRFEGIQGRRREGIPLQPTEEELAPALSRADALLLTSPDYYGFLAPLQAARRLCDRAGKPLLADGAHGAHLHFSECYAGKFADLWVDGVHKSLPALTQGAVVSAKGVWAERLGDAVRLFRTSSPSYPVMASVEYAVKFPRNEAIERAAEQAKRALAAAENDDWSKLLVPFGEYADAAQEYLERNGVYAEFNDGNYLMFYCSPCTKERELKRLTRLLKGFPRKAVRDGETERISGGGASEWVAAERAEGRVCALACGVFPPCVPLLCEGERISREKLGRLLKAKNTFGLKDGRILVREE